MTDTPRYTVQAAARAGGITEARLRTWERRYGVPSPARSATGRRLYSDRDVAVIRRMGSLIGSGVSPSLAAGAVLQDVGVARAAPAPQPASDPDAAALLDAATRLDAPAAHHLVRNAGAERGWAAALRDVVFPALVQLGHAWQAGAITPANEHMLSEAVRLELQLAIASAPRPHAAAPLALLACPPGERHDLGLVALRLLLAEQGIRVLFLGADLPSEALLQAVRASRPAAICLAGTSPGSLPTLILSARAITKARTGALLFLGGPVLTAAAAPVPGLVLPPDLGEAASVIADAIRPRAALAAK